MPDLLTRLRAKEMFFPDDMAEAAAEIERLREREAKLNAYISERSMRYRELQKEATGRYGLEPGQLQWQWRKGERTDTSELEWAITDALAMGGISAHPGDGVSCAAQIVTGYAAAVTKEKDAEIERLRAALEPFAAEAECWPDHHDDEPLVESFPEYYGKITVGACRRARAALAGSQEGADDR